MKLEQEMILLSGAETRTPYYEPLRAFGLAMACVAWAHTRQAEENSVKMLPIGMQWRASRNIRREFAKWALVFLAPDSYRIVPR